MPNGTCSIDICFTYGRIRRGWCPKHYARWRNTGDPLGLRGHRPATPAAVRFFRNIKLDPVTGCWLWQLAPLANGYGQFDNDEKQRESVHRFAYRLLNGPLTSGLDVDHDCHNRDPFCPGGPTCLHRLCCNPFHLVLRTSSENTLLSKGLTAQNARKTHCPQGHPYSGDNLAVYKRGDRTKRACRECMRERSRKFYWRQREKARTDSS